MTAKARYVFVGGSHATSHWFRLPIRSETARAEIAVTGQYHVGFRSIL